MDTVFIKIVDRKWKKKRVRFLADFKKKKNRRKFSICPYFYFDFTLYRRVHTRAGSRECAVQILFYSHVNVLSKKKEKKNALPYPAETVF